MGNPESDPLRILAKVRKTQPGRIVKVPGAVVDGLLRKYGIESREILVFADTADARQPDDSVFSTEFSLQGLGDDDSVFADDRPRAMDDIPPTPLPTFSDDGIPDSLMQKMYEAGRGEAGKKGVKQMPTDRILAQIDDQGRPVGNAKQQDAKK